MRLSIPSSLFYLLLASMVASVLYLPACKKPPQPVLSEINPIEGFIGQPITIRGERLNYYSALYFGEVAVEDNTIIVSETGDQMTTQVPPGLAEGPVEVYLQYDEGSSNALEFTVIPFVANPEKPAITCDRPLKVTVGEEITIQGQNFTSDGLSIFFEASKVEQIISVSETAITLLVPGISSSGNIRVITKGGTSAQCPFILRAEPVITSLEPDSSWIGGSIFINGNNFFADSTQVSFESDKAVPLEDIDFISPQQLKVIVPNGAISGNIRLQTPCGSTSFSKFTLIDPIPIIDSIVPPLAEIGDPVTIYGVNFSSFVKLTFGGVAAMVTPPASDTTINTTVPGGLTPGMEVPVVVQTTIGSSKPVNFQVATPQIPAPEITSVLPDSGRVGDQISIKGKNFTAGNNLIITFKSNQSTILLDQSSADFIGASNSEIAIKIPNNAWTGEITITNGNPQIAKVNFRVLPKITNINPAVVGIGASIAITGNNFRSNNLEVFFNTIKAQVINLQNANSLTAIVPSNALVGMNDVRVKTIDGSSNKLPVEITIPAPEITSFQPNEAVVGCPVTIKGKYFNLGSVVLKMGGVNVGIKSVSPQGDAIEIIVPPMNQALPAVATVMLSVGNNSTNSSLLINPRPKIAELLPSRQNKGGPIFIYGNNLDLIESVHFNNEVILASPSSPTLAQLFKASDIQSLSRDVVVTNAPQSFTGFSKLALKINNSGGCFTDSIDFEIGTNLSPSAPTGNNHTVTVPFPPPGISLGSIDNVWSLISGFTTDNPSAYVMGLNTGEQPSPPGTSAIVGDGNFDEVIGYFSFTGDTVSITLNGKEYRGSQDGTYPFITPNSRLPKRIILTPVNDFGEQLELVYPYVIDGLSPSKGTPGSTVTIKGRFFYDGDAPNGNPLAINFFLNDGDIDFLNPDQFIEFPTRLNATTLQFELPAFAKGEYLITVGLFDFSNTLLFTIE